MSNLKIFCITINDEDFDKLKAKRQSGELKTEYDRILEGSNDEK